jgi:hypothetical protein
MEYASYGYWSIKTLLVHILPCNVCSKFFLKILALLTWFCKYDWNVRCLIQLFLIVDGEGLAVFFTSLRWNGLAAPHILFV